MEEEKGVRGGSRAADLLLLAEVDAGLGEEGGGLGPGEHHLLPVRPGHIHLGQGSGGRRQVAGGRWARGQVAGRPGSGGRRRVAGGRWARWQVAGVLEVSQVSGGVTWDRCPRCLEVSQMAHVS